MGNSLTSYFLSFGARKTLLRLIIISSLSSFVINIIFRIQSALVGDKMVGGIILGLSIIPFSVFLHHILRLWPRDKWSVKSDFIYSAVELTFATGYLITEILMIAVIGGRYPQGAYKLSMVLCIFISPFFYLSILASFVLTIWKLHLSQYQTIRSTYDFMEKYDDVTIGWRRLKMEPGPWSLVFGENIFRRRFGIDRAFIRGLRAGISVLCLLGMIVLAYLVLFVQPVQQQLYFQTMGVTDDEVMRYMDDHMDVNVTVGVTLVIGRPPGIQDLLPEKAFEITWRNHKQQVPYDCSYSKKYHYSLLCPISSPFSPSAPEDLIISINYTGLLQQTSEPLASLRTGVHVYLDIYASAHPSRLVIQLYPGLHLFGTTLYSFRDTYANARNLAIGIPDFDRQLIANVQGLMPDPEFTDSNSDDTTATLRLTYQGDIYTIQPTVIKEQPNNTVLSGFALLGGIWTFINGLFAAIFGCSLLLVLFGIKPLSIYGLVHLFQRRRSLVDGGYTLSAEEQSRTIAVLREHLLDKENNDVKANEAGEERNQDEERMQLRDIA